MSLFGTIQQSSGALQAAQIGLQVVGNNIANANTDGYIRQRLEQTPAIAVRDGGMIKGQGVRPTGITQVVDKALIERVYNSNTALAGAETLEKAYNQLEGLANDLDNNGLNQQLTLFNNALHELSTQPGDASIREFVVLQGEALANKLRTSKEQVIDYQTAWSSDLGAMANQVNGLTQRIAKLNVEIASAEGSGMTGSDATGLRDQRYADLEELASLVDINVQEQDNGTVAVFVGGDYLVTNGIQRDVTTAYNRSIDGQEIRILETDSPLQASGGKIAATLQARDGVFGDFVARLDSIAASLIRGVNEVHSQGQGTVGFDQLTSSVKTEAGVPLDQAGLAWTPQNGSFDMSVVDMNGDVISNHRIDVRKLGQVGDSTVSSIVAQIDSIAGISAGIGSDGRIQIASDSPTARFAFGEDTSGFLAAAGINTFFTGSNAGDIAVNADLQLNNDHLAVSRGGIGQDTDALLQLVDLVDRPLDSLDGRSVRRLYEQTVSGLAQNSSLQKSATEGLRNFHSTLRSQHLAVTGVNIDEESIRMIAYQRAFQASSRVIAAASEMLELLVSM